MSWFKKTFYSLFSNPNTTGASMHSASSNSTTTQTKTTKTNKHFISSSVTTAVLSTTGSKKSTNQTSPNTAKQKTTNRSARRPCFACHTSSRMYDNSMSREATSDNQKFRFSCCNKYVCSVCLDKFRTRLKSAPVSETHPSGRSQAKDIYCDEMNTWIDFVLSQDWTRSKRMQHQGNQNNENPVSVKSCQELQSRWKHLKCPFCARNPAAGSRSCTTSKLTSTSTATTRTTTRTTTTTTTTTTTRQKHKKRKRVTVNCKRVSLYHSFCILFLHQLTLFLFLLFLCYTAFSHKSRNNNKKKNEKKKKKEITITIESIYTAERLSNASNC